MDSDISIVERSPSPPLLLSDTSIAELEGSVLMTCTGGEYDVHADVTACDCHVSDDPASNVGDKKPELKSLGSCCAVQSDGPSSLTESAASETARAQALEQRLHATFEILKNKEETIRVQADSLSLAEGRIADLSEKLQRVKLSPPRPETRNSAVGCRVEPADVSAAAYIEGAEPCVVDTLRENLSVIEELYRECFYETAKQDALIHKLRRSYQDVRSLDRQKAAQIHRLRDVIRAGAWSRAQRRDVAVEVEELKSGIMNFLNNSNNDSGVWECGEGAAAELRHVAAQLLRLRELLTSDCTCGLEEENKKLRQANQDLELKVAALRRKVSDLETALEGKENVGEQYQRQIQTKEQELQCIRKQLVELEEGTRGLRSCNCEALSSKLSEVQDILDDKTKEVKRLNEQCEEQQAAIVQLREDIRKSETVANENSAVRDEVTWLSLQVTQWRRQLAEGRRRLQQLQDELRRTDEHCQRLHQQCRQKDELAEELQEQLSAAQQHGAELCGEARRAVCAVRRCLRKQRARTREHEETIKEQESIIRSFQSQTRSSTPPDGADREPCCSRLLSRGGGRSECGAERSERGAGRSECGAGRSERGAGRSERGCCGASETMRGAQPTPPVPPRRLLRRKPLCGDVRCQWAPDAGSLRPRHFSFACQSAPPGSVSSTEELAERVERAHSALAAAQRRWRGPRAAGPGPAGSARRAGLAGYEASQTDHTGYEEF